MPKAAPPPETPRQHRPRPPTSRHREGSCREARGGGFGLPAPLSSTRLRVLCSASWRDAMASSSRRALYSRIGLYLPTWSNLAVTGGARGASGGAAWGGGAPPARYPRIGKRGPPPPRRGRVEGREGRRCTSAWSAQPAPRLPPAKSSAYRQQAIGSRHALASFRPRKVTQWWPSSPKPTSNGGLLGLSSAWRL